jgi:uncharacterized protein (AIM24 family)
MSALARDALFYFAEHRLDYAIASFNAASERFIHKSGRSGTKLTGSGFFAFSGAVAGLQTNLDRGESSAGLRAGLA